MNIPDKDSLQCSVWLAGLDELRQFADLLAAGLPSRAVLGLVGTLGAGKTQLVRFLVAASGGDATQVCSPTFVLWQTYEGPIRIHHFDAYRLATHDAWAQLGGDEAFEEEGWAVIEWADRLKEELPEDTLWIELIIPEQAALSRVAILSGHSVWEPLARTLSARFPTVDGP
jgi:tRNA threonylcarbamoyladenosine biosynthesis protein TsaE